MKRLLKYWYENVNDTRMFEMFLEIWLVLIYNQNTAKNCEILTNISLNL